MADLLLDSWMIWPYSGAENQEVTTEARDITKYWPQHWTDRGENTGTNTACLHQFFLLGLLGKNKDY